jgi:hypothetical protein
MHVRRGGGNYIGGAKTLFFRVFGTSPRNNNKDDVLDSDNVIVEYIMIIILETVPAETSK